MQLQPGDVLPLDTLATRREQDQPPPFLVHDDEAEAVWPS